MPLEWLLDLLRPPFPLPLPLNSSAIFSQAMQWPLGPLIELFPWLRNRMLADPQFLFKVGTEVHSSLLLLLLLHPFLPPQVSPPMDSDIIFLPPGMARRFA